MWHNPAQGMIFLLAWPNQLEREYILPLMCWLLQNLPGPEAFPNKTPIHHSGLPDHPLQISFRTFSY